MAKKIVAFTIFPLVLVRFSTNSSLSRAYWPCRHHGDENYSNTQAIIVQPGSHALLSRENVHTGQVPCRRTQRHTAAAKTRSRDTHRATTLCVYMECIFRYKDTEGDHCQGRELVVLSGSFTFHSLSPRWHRHLRGHASHERYMVSKVKGRETNFHKPLPQRASNPGPLA